jgi:hypothetical protein
MHFRESMYPMIGFALALRGAARDDLIKEPGTLSSRRKLLNFPSRPPTRPSNVVVRNTKKAKTNLLVLISNSCQTAPETIGARGGFPEAVI